MATAATRLPAHPAAAAVGGGDVRVRFATRVRQEVERRKRARRVMGFDDLLSRVRDALIDPVTGPVARQRLAARFDVVLVDEFQDTDPVQWEVLRAAFHGRCTLIVIGDPKQSVYAFRGADVRAYLDARRTAGGTATLATSWRGDPALLDGQQAVFRGAALGEEDIVVGPVTAGHRQSLLDAAGPDQAPVRVRQLARDGLPSTKGQPKVDGVRRAVARDVAAEVVRTLAAGHSVSPRDGGEHRRLQARDIAVVVRTGLQANLVRDCLRQAGVPCVLTGTRSVFDTRAAADWLLLLQALEQPHRSRVVRRAALTALIGWSAADLDARGPEGTDELARTLRDWAQLLAERGVAALLAAVSDTQRLAERLLRRHDGERLLTDLRHVGEILHVEALGSQLGLAGQITWLHHRVEQARTDTDSERSRRLDTDAAAVHVATVHASKGLEFPVVLVPYGWDRTGGGDRERLPLGHAESGRRTLYVAGPAGPGYAAACAGEDGEDAGEELRLLYVAATRAISRLVLWWAPSSKTAGSPLHRLLFTAEPAAGMPAEVAVPADGDAAARLAELAAGSAGLAVQQVRAADIPELPAPPARPAHGALSASELGRELDSAWRRTSYTGLTRAAYENPVPVPPAGPVEAGPDPDEALRAVPSPMADLPAGAAFGTLVHAVLERADLTAADLRAELIDVARQQLEPRSGGIDADALADGLLPALRTPLGPLAGGAALAGIPRRDVLLELEFELPLDGGDRVAGDEAIRLGALAELLRRHLPAADPVAGYAAVLEHPLLSGQPLRGYLTGSLDVLLRVGPPGEPRYLVVDHKTNHLAPAGEPLTAWHYRRSALDAEVLHAHYPLQAMLYSVALHRFLCWRQPGYEPARHLGGVLYLFLRGMCGPSAPAGADGQTPGVWSWRPPAGLVQELSDLLAGRPR